jgi:hypothetical protein
MWGHDALEIGVTDRLKQFDPSPLNVVEIQKACLDARDERPRSALALEERSVAKVVAIDA